ncbi:MAG TPA: peptidoglycan-binding protein [Verrucomicrobiae bacterium]|nr:peptidoglycan-binding protein [Verrucomicrobiae bacterium]
MLKIKHLFLYFLLFSLFIPIHSFAQTDPNAGIEALVRASFPDMPAMIDIAKCESGYRQFNSNGTVLRGGGGKYVGIFQIDEQLHTSRAQSMAIDILTIEGNMAYARYLYFASGTNPWKGCVRNAAPPPQPVIQPTPTPSSIPVSTAPTGSLIENLQIGMTGQQVLLLQKTLNQKGFLVASSGPGSPGNETDRFGQLTREAVKKFQCQKGIVCDGNESTTGFGRFGPKTRALLNSL